MTKQQMDQLKLLRDEINARLEAYFATLPEGLGVHVSQSGEVVLERLQEFALRPGKRLRGALAVIGYEMFGGANHQTALDLALAVELAQDYLLIVDDVMDRSDLRRGGLTVHQQYRQDLERGYPGSDAEHLANMIGVNVGLISQHLAMLVLGEIDEVPERVVRAQRIFQTNIAATGFGQMDDLLNEAGLEMSLDDVRHMYMLKSSYYSFVNPLQLGAVLAGADAAQLKPMQEFGGQAGLAFQLQDDILGMFGDETTTGKSSLDDLREGKMTLLMRHALAAADPAQLQVLRAALGNKNVTEDQHLAVQDLLVALGSRKYVAQEAQAAAQAALKVLNEHGWDESGRAFLADLLNYVISRKN